MPASCSPGGRQQTLPRASRIVTTKDAAYLIGKIEPVLTGKISEVAPAPLGRYALIVQDIRPEPTDDVKQPFGEQKLWLYDALRHTTKLIDRVQDDPATQTYQSIVHLLWFPGTKCALVSRAGIRSLPGTKLDVKGQIGIFDVDRGVIRWISGLPAQLVMVREVAGLPGILLTWGPDETSMSRSYSVLTSDGSLTPLAKLVANGSVRVLGVSPDKKRLFLQAIN